MHYDNYNYWLHGFVLSVITSKGIYDTAPVPTGLGANVTVITVIMRPHCNYNNCEPPDPDVTADSVVQGPGLRVEPKAK